MLVFVALRLKQLVGRVFFGVAHPELTRDGCQRSDEDMQGMRSSSEPYAAFLAERVRTRHGATWGLAETGAAGPTGNRYGDAAGHTCIAVAGPTSTVLTLETGLDYRAHNMRLFGARALQALDEALAQA